MFWGLLETGPCLEGEVLEGGFSNELSSKLAGQGKKCILKI